MVKLSLSPEQLVLLQNYDTSDLPFDPETAGPAAFKDSGDGLFSFLFSELAKDGDTPRREYIQRLKRAELQVREVREALEYHTAKACTDALSVRDALWWFIENVPLDASWRSNLFFDLRARMQVDTIHDPAVVLVAMRGSTQIECAIMDNERVVRVNVQKLVEAGYSVASDGMGEVAYNGDWVSSPTTTLWAAWALAQEHHDQFAA